MNYIVRNTYPFDVLEQVANFSRPSFSKIKAESIQRNLKIKYYQRLLETCLLKDKKELYAKIKKCTKKQKEVKLLYPEYFIW